MLLPGFHYSLLPLITVMKITMPESKDLYPKDVSDFYEFLNDHTQEINEDATRTDRG